MQHPKSVLNHLLFGIFSLCTTIYVKTNCKYIQVNNCRSFGFTVLTVKTEEYCLLGCNVVWPIVLSLFAFHHWRGRQHNPLKCQWNSVTLWVSHPWGQNSPVLFVFWAMTPHNVIGNTLGSLKTLIDTDWLCGPCKYMRGIQCLVT
jgi:hypothetical protein